MIRDLFTPGHGLVITAGKWTTAQALTLWEDLSERVETVYFVGPLADKPLLHGGAKVWLLECPPDDRAAGLREVLRCDPHGIVLIGGITAAEATLVVTASLSGSLCVVSTGCATMTEAFESLRPLGVEPFLVASALVGACTPDATLALTDAMRQSWIGGGPIAVDPGPGPNGEASGDWRGLS